MGIFGRRTLKILGPMAWPLKPIPSLQWGRFPKWRPIKEMRRSLQRYMRTICSFPVLWTAIPIILTGDSNYLRYNYGVQGRPRNLSNALQITLPRPDQGNGSWGAIGTIKIGAGNFQRRPG